ncbi:unnamed protein product (macronuclear) [Paramecium tetraurelia]|uniref:Uncharacterized protein n=2 Tax=Paramecium TaxID=5884 RepID=A0CKW8_PARTE|nr:uncharacterized protein GSPATT00007982001 [Paramecium tetraurelia]CAD8160001.1 unnamed protein product [Paramecium octaurelia]CAK71435.1 unnamed protein product [Paramecium tetraurelia]|eukprot:XP_001438832.1 hypothetical protein (macronuclear) [Paramecium tetraurelia strain d4-2]
MGNCSSQKNHKNNTTTTIKLEEFIKTVDHNNVHDQALVILYHSRNQRLNHLNEPVLSGFGKQFSRTSDQSQQRNST